MRDIVNRLVFFEHDEMNLRHAYNDYVNTDMSNTTYRYKNMCLLCWENKYGFLVIDKDDEIDFGRYWKGLDCFVTTGK